MNEENKINTSLEAFEKIKPELGERQLQVYKALRFLRYATNSMIADFLGLPINCITGRCKELRSQGIVEFSHVSWCPITKNKAKYWKIKK